MLPGPGVDTLATFEFELRGRKGTYAPVMKGSPAIVCGTFGKGRVVLCSPHCEDGMAPVLRQIFRFASSAISLLSPAQISSAEQLGLEPIKR